MNGAADLDIIPCKGVIVCCIIKAEYPFRGWIGRVLKVSGWVRVKASVVRFDRQAARRAKSQRQVAAAGDRFQPPSGYVPQTGYLIRTESHAIAPPDHRMP